MRKKKTEKEEERNMREDKRGSGRGYIKEMRKKKG